MTYCTTRSTCAFICAAGPSHSLNRTFCGAHIHIGAFLSYSFRQAIPEDAPTCVTIDTWRQGIEDESFPGYVCVHEGAIVGYCFGEPASLER